MRVTALNKFEYANKLRMPGDEFETTSEKDADILILAQQVRKAPERAETRAMKAEEEQPPMTTENSKPITPARKNRYQTRHLRAEE